MGAEFKIEGMGDLLDEVERMATAPAKIENAALKAAAQPILEESQRNLEKESPHHLGKTSFKKSSVDTGKLKDSGEVSNVKKDKYGGQYVKIQYTDPVAHLVEEGHGGRHQHQRIRSCARRLKQRKMKQRQSLLMS